jgi:hypothetical protein
MPEQTLGQPAAANMSVSTAAAATTTCSCQVLEDMMAARDHLRTPTVKLGVLTIVRLRDALRTALLLPLALPAAAAARWHALFASQRYEQFLMAEGERVWAFRNRTENERWFWEVFAMERCAACALD